MGSDASSNAEVKLGFYYDLGKKEILLRFDSSAFASAYQAKNPEGRILADQPREVWLPVTSDMKSLRSSDGYGLVIVFHSKEARRTWLNRSVLGEDVNTSDGEYGVRFKRIWLRGEFDQRLDYPVYSLRSSLGVPGDRDHDRQDPRSRPVSRDGRSPAPRLPPPPPPAYEPYVSMGSSNYYEQVESRGSERPRY